MLSHHLNYMLGTLSFGLLAAFVASSSDRDDLARANTALVIRLDAAQSDIRKLRDKYAVEIKAREFAEAARDIAENQVVVETGRLKTALAEEAARRETAETALLATQVELQSALLPQARNERPDAAAARSGAPAVPADSRAPVKPEAALSPAEGSVQASMLGVGLGLLAVFGLAFGASSTSRFVR